MALVHVAPEATKYLTRLIAVLNLPDDTAQRVKRSIEPLADFPMMGKKVSGEWQGLHSLVGPWPWLIIVYDYEEEHDRVTVVTIEDSRSPNAVTGTH